MRFSFIDYVFIVYNCERLLRDCAISSKFTPAISFFFVNTYIFHVARSVSLRPAFSSKPIFWTEEIQLDAFGEIFAATLSYLEKSTDSRKAITCGHVRVRPTIKSNGIQFAWSEKVTCRMKMSRRARERRNACKYSTNEWTNVPASKILHRNFCQRNVSSRNNSRNSFARSTTPRRQEAYPFL